MARSYKPKNQQFESNQSNITKRVAAIKSHRFALLDVIWQISRSHRSKNGQLGSYDYQMIIPSAKCSFDFEWKGSNMNRWFG